MTYDDDFCQLETPAGTRRVPCKSLGYSWPPPESIHYGGHNYTRASCSEITDDERKDMTHVCRGALYHRKVANAA